MVCMDAGDDYEIVLSGTGKGSMDYSIRFYDKEGSICKENTFTNVPISKKTVIYTGTNRNDDITLNIDRNGDGTVDEVWTVLGKKQKPSCFQDNNNHSFSEENTMDRMVIPIVSTDNNTEKIERNCYSAW